MDDTHCLSPSTTLLDLPPASLSRHPLRLHSLSSSCTRPDRTRHFSSALKVRKIYVSELHEMSRIHVRISTAAENGLIVIQTKNITLTLFSTNAIFGMLVVSWQLSYCIFGIKRVFLKPFGKSYIDICIRKLNFKCILLSFYFWPPTDVYVAVTSSRIDQSSWNMHQIKAEWLIFHIMYVTQLFFLGTYDSFC